jgi:hypothetical protein
MRISSRATNSVRHGSSSNPAAHMARGIAASFHPTFTMRRIVAASGCIVIPLRAGDAELVAQEAQENTSESATSSAEDSLIPKGPAE